MERNRDSICADVLADALHFAAPEGYVKEWDVNGEKVTLGVKR